MSVTATIDTEGDWWTCNRVMVNGIWTTQEYASWNPWGRRYCRSMNPISWNRCPRCGFPRPTEERGF